MVKPLIIHDFIHYVLQEDIGSGDITTNSMVPKNVSSTAEIVAKADGVISGLKFCRQLIAAFSTDITVIAKIRDGEAVKKGELIATLKGGTRELLSIERTLLNFLQQLSGVATLTRQFVDAVDGTSAKILDTRKTIPGLRLLQKQAVKDGGGHNHRIGLYDMVLIKENHLAAYVDKPLLEVIRMVKRKQRPGIKVELEVDSLAMVSEAITCPVNIIMLDNFSVAQATEAVQIIKSAKREILTEISGNVSLKTVRAYAQTGVDRISIGALTHSAPALDLSMIIT